MAAGPATRASIVDNRSLGDNKTNRLELAINLYSLQQLISMISELLSRYLSFYI